MVPRFEALVDELVREQPERRGALALRRRRARSGSGWRSSSANWFTACACRPRCPGCEVVFCEHPIEVADGGLCRRPAAGRVDRVDADAERGRFVVIDYKGSSKDYASGLKEGDEPSVPHHVQGLIYAQALLRTDLGLACAGALYLGYRAQSPKELLAGAYDGAAFDPAGLSSRSSAVAMNFSAYLDAIEALVADRLAALSEGAIPVSPSAPKACEFCPAYDCPGRLA
ncbi:MAG: PD-(D/E)XK nuclease family protein [Coriobacteriaceae bacterium]